MSKTSDRSLTLGANKRLRTRSDISNCKESGEKIYSKHFLFLYFKTNLPTSRVATAITTKIDKRAVFRNRIKRRIKEVFRLHQLGFTCSFDLLVVARRDSQLCTYAQCEDEILTALKTRKLYVESVDG